jgi:hypothetical protein
MPINAQRETFKNEVQVSFGGNNYSYFETETAYSYMFSDMIGGIAGLNFFESKPTVITSIVGALISEDIDISSDNSSDPNYFLLRTGGRFKYPFLRKNNEDILYINVEPGLYINPFPNEKIYMDDNNWEVKSKGVKWLSFNFKSYLQLNFYDILFSLGYTISNFDVYAAKRNVYRNYNYRLQDLPREKLQYSFYLQMSYCF